MLALCHISEGGLLCEGILWRTRYKFTTNETNHGNIKLYCWNRIHVGPNGKSIIFIIKEAEYYILHSRRLPSFASSKSHRHQPYQACCCWEWSVVAAFCTFLFISGPRKRNTSSHSINSTYTLKSKHKEWVGGMKARLRSSQRKWFLCPLSPQLSLGREKCCIPSNHPLEHRLQDVSGTY